MWIFKKICWERLKQCLLANTVLVDHTIATTSAIADYQQVGPMLFATCFVERVVLAPGLSSGKTITQTIAEDQHNAEIKFIAMGENYVLIFVMVA